MKGVLVETRYYLKKGKKNDFYQRFRDNNIIELTETEDGNLGYEVYYPQDNKNDICFIEKWSSIDSYNLHNESLHFAILQELKEKYVIRVVQKKSWVEEIEEEIVVPL